MITAPIERCRSQRESCSGPTFKFGTTMPTGIAVRTRVAVIQCGVHASACRRRVHLRHSCDRPYVLRRNMCFPQECSQNAGLARSPVHFRNDPSNRVSCEQLDRGPESRQMSGAI
jgi:hypothetical protein